jgi:hypothetical protein
VVVSEMFALASALAEAKSRQDIPAAVALLHSDMVLENPAFGTVARGIEANQQALARFFTAFPTTRSSLTATPATTRPSSAGVVSA